MKFLQTPFLLLILLIFSSCGENTQTPITSDITSIEIEDLNVSIYSTDIVDPFNAIVNYEDGTSADITTAVDWSSSDTNVLSIYYGQITTLSNGGESNISISYETYNDLINLNIYGLKDGTLFISSDITTTGIHELNAQGDFINIDTNITMDTNRTIEKNIIWTANNNAIITIENDIANIDIQAGDTNVTASVFDINITKTYSF